MVQDQAGVRLMRILVKVINALSVDRRRPSFDAMNNIPFRQQQFRKISAILPRDTRNQRRLRHAF
jgi:hypothetical protein